MAQIVVATKWERNQFWERPFRIARWPRANLIQETTPGSTLPGRTLSGNASATPHGDGWIVNTIKNGRFGRTKSWLQRRRRRRRMCRSSLRVWPRGGIGFGHWPFGAESGSVCVCARGRCFCCCCVCFCCTCPRFGWWKDLSFFIYLCCAAALNLGWNDVVWDCVRGAFRNV